MFIAQPLRRLFPAVVLLAAICLGQPFETWKLEVARSTFAGVEGIKLGEAIAISILRDTATLYDEVFPGFSFTKYDGTPVTICPEC